MDESHEKKFRIEKILVMNVWLAGFNVLPLPNDSSELRLNSLKKRSRFLS
jgi:hypothetical protein